jgi:hypothetical protein
MAPEESDRERACPVLDGCNQPVVVSLDIENNSAGLENARFWVGCLYTLRTAPISTRNDVEPRFILRSGRPDAFVARVIGQLSFDHVCADNDH